MKRKFRSRFRWIIGRGLVIFGAPGSQTAGNMVQTSSRTLLGGINLVDFAPDLGNYDGTVVSNHIIDSTCAGYTSRFGSRWGQRSGVSVMQFETQS